MNHLLRFGGGRLGLAAIAFSILAVLQCKERTVTPVTEVTPTVSALDSVSFGQLQKIKGIAQYDRFVLAIAGHKIYSMDTANLANLVDSLEAFNLLDQFSYLAVDSLSGLTLVWQHDSISVLEVGKTGSISKLSRFAIRPGAYSSGTHRMAWQHKSLWIASMVPDNGGAYYRGVQVFDLSDPASPTLSAEFVTHTRELISLGDKIAGAGAGTSYPDSLALWSGDVLLEQIIGFNWAIFVVGAFQSYDFPMLVLNTFGTLSWIPLDVQFDTSRGFTHDFGADMQGALQVGSETVISFTDGQKVVLRGDSPVPLFSCFLSRPSTIVSACGINHTLFVADSLRVYKYIIP